MTATPSTRSNPVRLSDQFVVAISSRVLFDMREGHEVFVKQGVEAYGKYQAQRENETLKRGMAFPLVQKLLALNELLPPSVAGDGDGDGDDEGDGDVGDGDDGAQAGGAAGRKRPFIEVVLVSRNTADTGLRVFHSIAHYGLGITRAVFTGGASPYKYIKSLGADLFLSADAGDVSSALNAGYAAATVLPSRVHTEGDQLRIAFDGDAVLFSDEAERVYQERGLQEFIQTEQEQAATPLPGGPFKGVLAAIHRIQSQLPPHCSPVRTALLTARDRHTHKRVILTLRAWGIRIDEVMFLGGLDKGHFLHSFGADIFFDDQTGSCDGARRHVLTGHVPHGVAGGGGDGRSSSPE